MQTALRAAVEFQVGKDDARNRGKQADSKDGPGKQAIAAVLHDEREAPDALDGDERGAEGACGRTVAHAAPCVQAECGHDGDGGSERHGVVGVEDARHQAKGDPGHHEPSAHDGKRGRFGALGIGALPGYAGALGGVCALDTGDKEAQRDDRARDGHGGKPRELVGKVGAEQAQETRLAPHAAVRVSAAGHDGAGLVTRQAP